MFLMKKNEFSTSLLLVVCQCANIITMGFEVVCMISEGLWFFIDIPDSVKVSNTFNFVHYSLFLKLGPPSPSYVALYLDSHAQHLIAYVTLIISNWTLGTTVARLALFFLKYITIGVLHACEYMVFNFIKFQELPFCLHWCIIVTIVTYMICQVLDYLRSMQGTGMCCITRRWNLYAMLPQFSVFFSAAVLKIFGMKDVPLELFCF